MGDGNQKSTGYQPWWAIDNAAWRERFAVFYKLKGISDGRAKPLPPWTSEDVEEFVKSDPLYGPRGWAFFSLVIPKFSFCVFGGVLSWHLDAFFYYFLLFFYGLLLAPMYTQDTVIQVFLRKTLLLFGLYESNKHFLTGTLIKALRSLEVDTARRNEDFRQLRMAQGLKTFGIVGLLPVKLVFKASSLLGADASIVDDKQFQLIR